MSLPSEQIHLKNQMAEFVQLEEIQNYGVYTLEEKRYQEHFELNVGRGKDGRFTVIQPFRDTSKLDKLYSVALRRFLALERRLQADNHLKKRKFNIYERILHVWTYENINTQRSILSSTTPHYPQRFLTL